MLGMGTVGVVPHAVAFTAVPTHPQNKQAESPLEANKLLTSAPNDFPADQ